MKYIKQLEKFCKDKKADFLDTGTSVRVQIEGMTYRFNGNDSHKEDWAKELLSSLK